MISFDYVLHLGLYLFSGCSVFPHTCKIPQQCHFVLQHTLPPFIRVRLKGAKRLLKPTFSDMLKVAAPVRNYHTPSDGINLIQHKTKNLEILDKYQNKEKLCLAYPAPLLPTYTHTPPADPHRHMPKIIIQVSLCIHI